MLLSLAAVTLCLIACMHSFLGEKYILTPLLAEPQPDILRRKSVNRLLRWVWHWMSIAIVAFALLLLLAKGSALEPEIVLGAMVLWSVTALICLACAGPGHPGFLGFTLVVLMLIAQRVQA